MTPDKELRLLAEEVIPFIETRNSEIWKAYRAATPPETILALLDRLEASNRDAERYRWIEKNSYLGDEPDCGEFKWYLPEVHAARFDEEHRVPFDAAIDAAIKESK